MQRVVRERVWKKRCSWRGIEGYVSMGWLWRPEDAMLHEARSTYWFPRNPFPMAGGVHSSRDRKLYSVYRLFP